MGARTHSLERISRIVTLTAFAIATLSVILAPMLALSWTNRPFPGFLMDHALVVTDQGGRDGPGAPQASISASG